MEQHIDFSFTAPYYTLNELSDWTTDIWIACSGYGQLGKYFIRKFDVFDKDKNFIVTLQGLSKFYIKDSKRVGASWMTKEGRETDMQNQKSYFEAVLKNVIQGRRVEDFNVHLLGFSQGVSMISRMAAYSNIIFKTLILWAGRFPLELTSNDFSFVDKKAKLKVILGASDEYYAIDKNYQPEIDRMKDVVGLEPELIVFEGGHEMTREVLAGCTY